MKRQSIERQLEIAKARLDVRNGELTAAGVADAQRRTDPAWRSIDARRRQLVTRLRAIADVEKIDADLKARKAGAEEPPASPPPSKSAAPAKKKT